MHPLLSRLLGATGGRTEEHGLPKGYTLVRRARGQLRLIRRFDLGPGWAEGRHPGSKRPLGARVRDRRRRNKEARAARRRNR